MNTDYQNSSEIKKISTCITNCTRNVNDLKKIIETMINDSSIYNTRSNTLSKSLMYINNNINVLENLFLVADNLSHGNGLRKKYIILIETTISDLKNFHQKLDKIKTHNDDIRALTEYLENTTI